MREPSPPCLLISDFNVLNFAGHLESDEEAPALAAAAAPYGQVVPVLLDEALPCWSPPPEMAVVWTRPEAVLPAFTDALALQPLDVQRLRHDVDAYAAALLRASERVRALLVPTWVMPQTSRGHGLLDLRPRLGVAGALMQANLRLCAAVGGASNVFVLDAQRWMAAGGGASAPLWHMAKVPIAAGVFEEAAKDVKAAWRALHGEARKLVILDLDETLWGGVVGDVGWERLRLGGHDPAGEAFVDFQRALQALGRRGVLLGIASKNTEAVALEAIDRHPEMALRRKDFAGWRIDWQDKAKNIVELTRELRLGLGSVVFIDDNPVERARVREALPEVLVPDWPRDPMQYRAALEGLRCFDTLAVSDEDRERAAMYASEHSRSEAMRAVSSPEEWLATLEVVVGVEPLGEGNLTRVAQLLNKTNQMNLRTRRLTEAELVRWAAEGDREVWAFRVRDRFGDSGLVGVASLSFDRGIAAIADFVLSCRVMGRKVEEAMVAWLVDKARARGVDVIEAELLETPRNGPCLELWRRSGFACDGGLRFRWSAAAPYPPPRFVDLVPA